MEPTSLSNADPLERELEMALRPGEFIHDRACYSFVRGLEEVAVSIDSLLAAEPARAAGLSETFLAGCHAKAEEIDDSSGGFGQFAGGMICRWVRSQQAAGAIPVTIASRLLAWMDDDPYCFFHGIEVELPTACGSALLAAIAELGRAQLDLKPARYEQQRWDSLLRAIYRAQGNLEAYLELARRTGLQPGDCLVAAGLLAPVNASGALAWVERGLSLESERPGGTVAGYHLQRMHRGLLCRLGRQEEALLDAWAEFQEHPSKSSFDEIFNYVPAGEAAAWRQKALDQAANAFRGDQLYSLLDLFLAAEEWGRLAGIIGHASDQDLEALSHAVAEPAAKALHLERPELAGRMWRAQAMRILTAGKSRYYDAALGYLASARDCFQQAGLEAEWARTVRQLSTEHRRKAGFIGAFQGIALGGAYQPKPSFLEAAKADWSRRHGEGKP